MVRPRARLGGAWWLVGLAACGWSLASAAGYTPCGRNGELDGERGLIMVR